MKVSSISGKQVAKNSFWKFCESIGVQMLQLVITIVLARVLGPDDYGLMAIILVVVNFVSIFINSNISSYLVYVKDINKQALFTALIVNLSISIALSFLLFVCADKIADFYSSPALTDLIRMMIVIIPFSSISSIYNAYAIKMSLHKSLFFRNMIALPVSGILALILAFYGFGVWALVWQQVSYNILLAVIIVITIKIDVDGKWMFDRNRLKPMLSYGGYTLMSSFIAFIGDNINDLIIGKKISSEHLGYYNRGNALPGTITNVVNNVLTGVFFPAFSSYNHDVSLLKEKCRKTIRVLYFVFFPLMFGLIVCAKPFVSVVLTEKWADAVPIIQMACLYFCAIPYLQTCSQVYLAAGSMKIRTTGEVIKLLSTILLLIFFVGYGIVAVAFSRVLVALIMIFFSIIVNSYMMNYSIREFLSDIIKPFVMSSIMVLCIYPILFLKISDWQILCIQVTLGLLIYGLFTRFIKNDEIDQVINLIRHK